jgi:hypothetical protein
MVFANILAWFGKMIGGVGNYKAVLTVVAWSLVPTILGGFITLFTISYLGLEGYMGGRVLSNHESITMMVIGFVKIVLGIWSMVILVVGLSVAHKVGIGKALLILFLPIFSIFIGVAAIAFILGDLFSQ